MKKMSSLALAAVLACGMAVPAFAADGTTRAGANDVTTNNASGMTNNVGARYGTNAASMQRMNGTNGVVNGTNGIGNGVNARGTRTGYGVDGFRMNNTTRAAAAADNDGVDWGWLGLAGLIGLAGLRGRERTTR